MYSRPPLVLEGCRSEEITDGRPQRSDMYPADLWLQAASLLFSALSHLSLPSSCLATTATTTSTTSKTTRSPHEQKLQPPPPSPPLTFHTGPPDATAATTTATLQTPHAALNKPLTRVIFQNTCASLHTSALTRKSNTSIAAPRGKVDNKQARTSGSYRGRH